MLRTRFLSYTKRTFEISGLYQVILGAGRIRACIFTLNWGSVDFLKKKNRE